MGYGLAEASDGDPENDRKGQVCREVDVQGDSRRMGEMYGERKLPVIVLSFNSKLLEK